MRKTKYIKFILAAFFIIATPLAMFAQDSTAAGGSESVGIAQTILEFLSGKWPIISTIGTMLFFVSEALALIPKVGANSVFQFLVNVFSIFKKKQP